MKTQTPSSSAKPNVLVLCCLQLVAFTLILFLGNGCLEENENANLTITVVGTLSGKPRENITVQLFNTKESAEDRVNSVTGRYTTDANGQVTITGLSSGRAYYARADAKLATSYKMTQTLRDGDNTFSMSIL